MWHVDYVAINKLKSRQVIYLDMDGNTCGILDDDFVGKPRRPFTRLVPSNGRWYILAPGSPALGRCTQACRVHLASVFHEDVVHINHQFSFSPLHGMSNYKAVSNPIIFRETVLAVDLSGDVSC